MVQSAVSATVRTLERELDLVRYGMAVAIVPSWALDPRRV